MLLMLPSIFPWELRGRRTRSDDWIRRRTKERREQEEPTKAVPVPEQHRAASGHSPDTWSDSTKIYIEQRSKKKGGAMAQQTSSLVEPAPPALQQGLGTIGLRNVAASTIFRSDPRTAGPTRYFQLPPERRHYGATDLATMWDPRGPCGTATPAVLPD